MKNLSALSNIIDKAGCSSKVTKQLFPVLYEHYAIPDAIVDFKSNSNHNIYEYDIVINSKFCFHIVALAEIDYQNIKMIVHAHCIFYLHKLVPMHRLYKRLLHALEQTGIECTLELFGGAKRYIRYMSRKEREDGQ